MTRVARLACLIFITTLLHAASAAAQAPAVDQYTTTGASGAGAQQTGSSGDATGNESGSGATHGSGTGTGTGSGSGSGSGSNGSGSGTTGTTGTSGTAGSSAAPRKTAAGAAGAAASGALAPTLRIAFGAVSDRLASEIDAALLQGGIVPSTTARLRRADVERFLDSALARQLSSGDAEDVGRAVGRLVVDPGPQTSTVLEALLGYAPAIGDATHAVFTRSHMPKGDYADFQKGVVEGSDDVPRAYAELSTAKRSFVKAFDAIGLPTVDSIDTPAGKAALVAILVSGAEGNFGSKPSADAKLVAGEVRPLSATIGDAGDATVSYVLLGLVVFAVAGSVLGLRPRRRRA